MYFFANQRVSPNFGSQVKYSEFHSTFSCCLNCKHLVVCLFVSFLQPSTHVPTSKAFTNGGEGPPGGEAQPSPAFGRSPDPGEEVPPRRSRAADEDELQARHVKKTLWWFTRVAAHDSTPFKGIPCQPDSSSRSIDIVQSTVKKSLNIEKEGKLKPQIFKKAFKSNRNQSQKDLGF